MAVSTIDPNGLNVGQLGGDRNILINGAMTVAQRGTSFTGVTGGNTTYAADRFSFGTSVLLSSTYDITNSSDAPDGFSNSFKIDCQTADTSLTSGEYVLFAQSIEAQNLQHLDWGTSNAKQVTLSFWVKSNKTATYVVELNHGENNENNPLQWTINSADTWEYKSLTFNGNTSGAINNDNGRGLSIHIWLAAGSTYTSGTYTANTWHSTNADRVVGIDNFLDSTSNYINFTGVQFEVGDTATDFEHESYGTTLQKCKRYYEIVWYGTPASNAGTTASYGAYFQTGVPMRAAPSASQTASTSFYDFPGANVNSANNQFTAGLNSVSGGSTYYRAQQASSSTRTYFEGFITLDAEL